MASMPSSRVFNKTVSATRVFTQILVPFLLFVFWIIFSHLKFEILLAFPGITKDFINLGAGIGVFFMKFVSVPISTSPRPGEWR